MNVAKRRVLDAYRRALAAVDVRRAVEDACARLPAGPYRVIAIGKAAKAMFAGTRALDVEGSVVVGPEDAGHPLPDARSVRAAKACLELVSRPGDARILVLISGGASALVCAPASGVTLADKRAVTRAMLASGAAVQEINVVRKHLSCIKGGGLARAASPRDIVTLVVSDVIGGDASDVGSGPSVPDASTIGQARALLRRHAPAFAELSLASTLARAGQGGRCSHLAALVARSLPRDVTFAAIATDGIDGASGTAGAIVTAMSGADLDRAIARFDTGPFLLDARSALPSKPTGNNFADLHVLVRT